MCNVAREDALTEVMGLIKALRDSTMFSSNFSIPGLEYNKVVCLLEETINAMRQERARRDGKIAPHKVK